MIIESEKEVIFCHPYRNAEVNRDPNKKYYVSFESYAEKHFPTYCSGQGYVLSRGAVHKILKNVHSKDLLIGIEDVIFTGVVPERAGVPRHRHPGFQLQVGGGSRRITEQMAAKLCSERKSSNFIFHGIQSQENLTKLWKKYKECENEPGFWDNKP